VEFRILGPLELLASSGEAVALGRSQQRAVLALLLISAPDVVSRDRLVDGLWGERPPASAAHAVQVHVSGIRKILRGAAEESVQLRGSAAGYALEADLERIDAKRFERLIGDGQAALSEDPSHARDLFEQALGLWHGSPLADLREFEFAAREADRLEELHATATERVVESRLALGENDQVIGPITGLVEANPLRERPRRLLMLALYRSGRHAEALAAYRDAVAALDEIGLEPSPELRQLEQEILRHDALLAAPPRKSGAAGEVRAVDGPTAVAQGAVAPAAPEAAGVGGGDRERLVSARRRKVVTALFCDVTGSTELGEELDPEALVDVMNRYFAEIRAVIERHGGTVAKFIGDAVMAVFGIPRVHEDDALRAVRAAAEIRDRLPAIADEVGVALRFRTGVNTGLVLVGEGENLAIGDAVNVAARLEQAAAPGEILLGEETLRLVRDAVQVQPLDPLVLKGKSGAVRAFRVVRLDPLAPGLARHLDAPLVGRQRELGLLCGAWGRTVRESGCHLFTLLGVAGVGKSRLVSELLRTAGDEAAALAGRCLPYGEGITFWPLIEALTPVGEPAREVLDLLGSGGTAVPEELFFEVRRLLEALALEQAAILHIDDLQWAEPMLLDLIDHITDLSRGAPILLVCTARPELLDERPAWGGGKLNATTVLLEPLETADCELLLDQLGDGLAPDARARVIAASQGNPLFLEEMVALARDDQTLAIPSTIQALLAARLEGLESVERELLERGAIEGEVFHLSAVGALTDTQPGRELGSRAARLVRKELIRPHPPTFQGDEAFRFRHLLLRNAAYDGLPKATRAQLHERFANWLEAHATELAEVDEIAGWHLEQAIRYRRELGRGFNSDVALRAVQHLHFAGRRAAERSDPAAARNLLDRAHALASDDDTLRARIAIDLAEQLIEGGDLARVDELISVGERTVDTAPAAALIRLEWLLFTVQEHGVRTVESTLPQLMKQLAQAGDERGLARACMLAMQVHWKHGTFAAAAEQGLLAAEHARRAGEEGLRSRALGHYIASLTASPQPASAIAKRVEAIEAEDVGPYVAAFLDLLRGQLARFAGRLPEARDLTQQAIDHFRALGISVMAGACYHELAATELSADDPPGALAGLLKSDEILAELGERNFRSTTQATLARVYELLEDAGAARDAIERAEELGGPDDVLNYAITHAVRARLALAESDGATAERWARSAVEHANRMDNPSFRGDARLELARTLGALGHQDDAGAQARAALEIYEAKGDRPGADKARAALDRLEHRT
jgi:class 3 adenylate cyclase/DNA-binding winged helix-turn-helix (wHTH) protein